MKVKCQCGHTVAIYTTEKEKFWIEHAKLCKCVDCYSKETGYHAGENAVMIREIEYEAVK